MAPSEHLKRDSQRFEWTTAPEQKRVSCSSRHLGRHLFVSRWRQCMQVEFALIFEFGHNNNTSSITKKPDQFSNIFLNFEGLVAPQQQDKKKQEKQERKKERRLKTLIDTLIDSRVIYLVANYNGPRSHSVLIFPPS